MVLRMFYESVVSSRILYVIGVLQQQTEGSA